MLAWLKSLLFDEAPAPARPRAELELHDVPSSDRVRMGQIFGDMPTAAGAVVNERTAMKVSAVSACVRLIAGAIAALPVPIYRRTEKGREQVDHPLWWLLNEQPTPRYTAASFWEFVTAQMLLRGDGIAYIDRAGPSSAGIRGFIPVKRDNALITRRGDRLVYTIFDVDDDGEVGHFNLDQDDVLHFAGMGFNGISSMSVIQWAARQSIGVAMKADEHAAQIFGSGAHIQYAIKSPKRMSPEQQDDFRAAWVAKYSGQGISSMPLVLTEGLDVQELALNAVDSQLLESRRYQVVDIARAFGVPPHMIGETSQSTSWGSGIEQMGIGFVIYTLLPHLRRFAQELNRKLWPRSMQYFTEFNVAGLLAGDSKTQAEVFAKALGGPGTQGYMTVNEVRRLKNLPPVPGGDDLIFAGSAPVAPAKETEQ
jgi:HK97 family phage portal protein